LTSSGRRFQYRQIGTAAADGHFFMTVPYATTGPSDSDVEPAGAASLELDGWSKAIEIPEAAVQEGGVISIR